MTAALAGCGGPPTSPAPGSGAGGRSQETLNVTITAHNTGLSTLYVAQANGYFADESLSVNVTVDPNVLPTMVSGQTDLAIWTPVSGLLAAIKGKQVQNILAVQTDPGMQLFGSAKYANTSQLQSANSCRLATTVPGSLAYAYALRFKQVLGLKCDIIVLSTIPLIAAGLKSGTVDAAVICGCISAQVLGSDKAANVLIDPFQSDFATRYALPNAFINAAFGLPDHLKSKSEAVTRFIRAMVRAQRALANTSLAQLAGILQKQQPDTFGSQSLDSLDLQLKYVLPSIVTRPGEITASFWASCLKSYDMWQAQGFSSTDPAVGYSRAVNMTYYKQATASQ
jgi:ABC-type nitrate/sulfonate/bicarbonate transport system substrate-binding protein